MKSDRSEKRNTGNEEAAASAIEGEAAEEVREVTESEAPAEQVGTDTQQELQERFLRLAAEFDNFRKRTERERGESWIRAQAELVKKLLDPLDDLQRVADYTVDSSGVEALQEGVQMVERKLLRALESAGLEVIEAGGQPFDPAVHEALMTASTAEQDEDDSVGAVFQKGYAFKGTLLRPARVQVRKFEG
jgi:molecular chaperone GrpE